MDALPHVAHARSTFCSVVRFGTSLRCSSISLRIRVVFQLTAKSASYTFAPANMFGYEIAPDMRPIVYGIVIALIVTIAFLVYRFTMKKEKLTPKNSHKEGISSGEGHAMLASIF